MPPLPQPAAEVEVSVELVRSLLREQHPDLADRPLEVAAFGWDNVMLRLGADLAVRVPRRQVAARLVRNEQRWLPLLAPKLPLPVPVPLRVGEPGAGYPWPWTVCRWLPGGMAATVSAEELDLAAITDDLAQFLRALHTPAPEEAPANPVRGGPLHERDESMRSRVSQLGGLVDAAAVLRRWGAAVALPAWDGAPLWLHGDLHPANVLVSGGRVSAIVDFGDITAGDPATDLSVAWMLLPPAERVRLRQLVQADAATWGRARGWALALGVAMLSSSADNPVIAGVGRRTVAEVLADQGS